jgi:hypothetical protein
MALGAQRGTQARGEVGTTCGRQRHGRRAGHRGGPGLHTASRLAPGSSVGLGTRRGHRARSGLLAHRFGRAHCRRGRPVWTWFPRTCILGSRLFFFEASFFKACFLGTGLGRWRRRGTPEGARCGRQPTRHTHRRTDPRNFRRIHPGVLLEAREHVVDIEGNGGHPPFGRRGSGCGAFGLIAFLPFLVTLLPSVPLALKELDELARSWRNSRTFLVVVLLKGHRDVDLGRPGDRRSREGWPTWTARNGPIELVGIRRAIERARCLLRRRCLRHRIRNRNGLLVELALPCRERLVPIEVELVSLFFLVAHVTSPSSFLTAMAAGEIQNRKRSSAPP